MAELLNFQETSNPHNVLQKFANGGCASKDNLLILARQLRLYDHHSADPEATASISTREPEASPERDVLEYGNLEGNLPLEYHEQLDSPNSSGGRDYDSTSHGWENRCYDADWEYKGYDNHDEYIQYDGWYDGHDYTGSNQWHDHGQYTGYADHEVYTEASQQHEQEKELHYQQQQQQQHQQQQAQPEQQEQKQQQQQQQQQQPECFCNEAKCIAMDYPWPGLDALSAHQSYAHGDQQIRMCALCDYQCSTGPTLRQHLVTAHEVQVSL
jgi:DNA segregation ATPase FtsK/SpoIIIE-like protein